MTEFEIAETRLENITMRQSDKFMASCPCHADSTPSLRVFRKENGGAGFHCFGGCDFQDIRKQLGLDNEVYTPLSPSEKAALSEKKTAELKAQKERQRKVMVKLNDSRPDESYHANVEQGMAFITRQWGIPRDIVDELKIGYCPSSPLAPYSDSITFPYYDTSRRLIRLTHRLIKPGKHGKYMPHAKGMPVAVYNTAAMSSRKIMMVEGEAKTAYLLQWFSVVGISGKNAFKQEWAIRFAGKQVYIALDPDAEEQAKQIGLWLVAAGASVRVVLLPEKPDDFLLNHGGVNGVKSFNGYIDAARKLFVDPRTQKVASRETGNRSYWSNQFSLA